jgi:hypothetical protein
MDTTLDLSASAHNSRRQNNALAFVGLCSTQDWSIQISNLICLLARALLSKTDFYVLSTSQVWKIYSSDALDALTDQLHLAWWTHPGCGKSCFTFDELNEAFEQYLQQVVVTNHFFAIQITIVLNLGPSKPGRSCA